VKRVAAGAIGCGFIGQGGEESHGREQWPLMAMADSKQ
jgi:hypothetical protein